MQRGLLAGAAVVIAAAVLAAIFWTGGEDEVPAEKMAASETAVAHGRNSVIAFLKTLQILPAGSPRVVVR